MSDYILIGDKFNSKLTRMPKKEHTPLNVTLGTAGKICIVLGHCASQEFTANLYEKSKAAM